MLKSKQMSWTFLEQFLYIYAFLVPNVAASYFCQFQPECDGKYYSTDPFSRLPFPEHPENDSTSTEPVTSKQQGLPDTCCQDCICGRNCRRTKESCCFPELTHTTVDEYVETCTYAQSPLPYVEMRYQVFAYYMVERNPPDGCLDTDFSTQHSGKECGEVDAAYWGSLHPVSSISTGKIYRNTHCAACHGVTDVKLWQARGTYSNLETYLTEDLEFGNIHFFNIDGKFNEINRRCFHGRIINNCPSSDFFIPETIDMDAKTVASACLTETFSPYMHEHVYSNVFCLLCNTDLRNYISIQNHKCGIDQESDISFSAILIPLTSTVHEKEQQQLACLNKQYNQIMPRCRNVLCQVGTILVDEKCQHVTQIVSSVSFMFDIVLMPTSRVTLLQLQMETIKELSDYLIQTWGDNWEVQNVDVSFDFSSKVETILVNLIYIKERVSMPAFLDQIKRNLNKSSHWTHNSRNESVYLKPSNTLGSKAISRETIDGLLESVDDIDDDGSIKDALNSSKTYKTVFSNPYITDPQFSSPPTTISEMFYCKQIELYHNEFVELSKEIVYIKHLDKLLFRDQFIEVPDRVGQGPPNIRICLYESGFSSNISSSGSRIRIVISNILAISVFTFTQLYCYCFYTYCTNVWYYACKLSFILSSICIFVFLLKIDFFCRCLRGYSE